MLSKEQIQFIAEKANEKVDLPVIGERFEEQILIFALKKIDKELDEHLPEEFAQLLDDVSDGFESGSPADMEKIKMHLVQFLNRNVNIPLIGEKAERELFTIAIDFIINAMKKNEVLKDS